MPNARRTPLMIARVNPIKQAPHKMQKTPMMATTASAALSSCVYFILIRSIEANEVPLLQSLWYRYHKPLQQTDLPVA